MASKWYLEQGKTPSEIAGLLDRDKSTLTRFFVKQVARKKQGRPPALSEADIDFLERRLHQLIVKCMGKYHVTAAMVKRSAKSNAGVKTIQIAFRKRRIFFRKMREKPLLTEKDIKARFAFAKKYRHKTVAWWLKAFHTAIDGKLFKVYLNGRERIRAAMHATYGAYRKPGKGLDNAYVKPKGKLHHNTGARSCLIQAAVGNGRVMMWHEVEGVWNGAAAALGFLPLSGHPLHLSSLLWALLGFSGPLVMAAVPKHRRRRRFVNARSLYDACLVRLFRTRMPPL